MAAKDQIHLFDRPVTAAMLFKDQMFARKRAENYSGPGVYFLEQMQALRLEATRIKMALGILRCITEISLAQRDEYLNAVCVKAKALAKEVYSSYCLMDAFYGDSGSTSIVMF